MPSVNPPQMDKKTKKLLNCCTYFLRLSGFPDLSGKVFLITFKFSELDYSTMFRKNSVNKTAYFF